MTCDHAQGLLSAAFDGERAADDPEVTGSRRHADSCADCARFLPHAERARELLRVGAPGARPTDTALADAVLARVRREDAASAARRTGPRHGTRHRRLPAAAVFVAAAAAAALLVHTSTAPRGPGVAEADLAERVEAAQHAVHSLDARLTVVERGWNAAVPERRFRGRLGYVAPETLTLSLRDHTDYPAGAWRPNDLRLTVDEDTWTVAGLVDCPSRVQPDCTPAGADHRTFVGRAPFSPAAPAPLELIMPVQSFALTGALETLPPATVDGRPTIGIETTAAQVAPLLDALRPTGNLREAHPTDPVRLRLDRDTLVPLRVTVRASGDPDRAAWADARGYVDAVGQTILDLTVHDLTVNAPAATAPSGRAEPRSDAPGAPPAPTDPSAVSDGGFRDRAVDAEDVPVPRSLPEGLSSYRTGVTTTPDGPGVSTRTWTDGRAWLAVAATGSWPGGRLFGDLGTIVRSVDLGPAGIGYLAEDGEGVGLHGDALDLVVRGSVGRDELLAVAAHLGVVGRTVPTSWDEAATADLRTARAALHPLLLPGDLDGFGPPAFRVEGASVMAAYAGPGDRAFVLDQGPATKLPPPVDADGVVPVQVRGVPGRFVPEQGALEWFEGGRLFRLRSVSLSRAELVDLAARLEPA